MHERSGQVWMQRVVATSFLAFAAVGGLFVGWSWAETPAPPAESPAEAPPADEPPAQPPPDAETPAPPAAPQAPSGEQFIPPDASTDAPAAPPAQPASPSPADAPGEPSAPGSDAPPPTSEGSSTSGAGRAAGAGVVAVGAGAAAAGGLLGRRPDETKDDYVRRMAGTTIWTVGGAAIVIAKGVTLASGLAGGACLVVAVAIWWWGAPGRARREPAPQGPPVPLEQHFDAARDHNLDMNRVGVKTQAQTTANPVDDP